MVGSRATAEDSSGAPAYHEARDTPFAVRRGGRTHSNPEHHVGPLTGTSIVGLTMSRIVALAACLAIVSASGCGAGAADGDDPQSGGPTGVEPADVGGTSDDGDAAVPGRQSERDRSPLTPPGPAPPTDPPPLDDAGQLEVIRSIDRIASGEDISAAEVMLRVRAAGRLRIFRLTEAELEALGRDERTSAIAQYDRLAEGLRGLGDRAVAEAAALAEAGDADAAEDLLLRVRELAAANTAAGLAEIGRAAAEALVAQMDEALAVEA